MLCDCGEKVFSFTKVGSVDGKKCTTTVSRCNRSVEYSGRKKKCSYRFEEFVKDEEVVYEPMIVEHPTIAKSKYNRNNLLIELERVIGQIKNCQELGYPFDHYSNIIFYLSKRLSIPPYIQEKQTIDEYHLVAAHYLKYPIPDLIHPAFVKYSFTKYFLNGIGDENTKDHFGKLLTIGRSNNKRVTKRSKSTVSGGYTGNVEFRTGGLDEDGENQEDELDIEEFVSEDEEDPCEDLGNYSD